MKNAFPLAYAHWYAARLFLDAGHPAMDILDRLGLSAERWKACQERYNALHFANTGWVASAFQREGLPAPEHDRALHAHLLAGGGIEPAPNKPFSMREQLAQIRFAVQADPHIGPFADVDWVAHYLCERRFPTIRYVHDGRRVLVGGHPVADRQGKPISGIDPRSFRRIGERWFHDGRRVYGQGETPTKLFWFVVRGADPDTFAVLNERYATDKAAGYYITNLRLPTEEPGTFEIVSYYYRRGQKPGIHTDESHYAKDSRKVYAYGVAIEGADAPSFHAIGDEGKYFADRHRIYWEKFPIAGADRETFTCASLAGQYRAYDKNQPYYAGQPQSVTAEFEHWRAFFEARPELSGTWWHREKTRRESASGHGQADAPASNAGQSLAPLGGPYFSDGARVLVKPQRPRDGEWISLDHIDHAGFRHIVDVFGADGHGLRYFIPGLEAYGCGPVKGAAPDSFQALGDGWYRDARQAYYMDLGGDIPELRIIKADLPTFEVLGGAYARDAKGLIVEGARKRGIDDPAAVVALGHLFARMGDTILYRGKPVTRPGKIDMASARGVHRQMLMDAAGRMLLGGRYRKPLPGLDPASFRFLNRDFAVDDNNVYAFTQDELILCAEADRASVETDGLYAVRDREARFHVSASLVCRTPLRADPD